MAHFEMQSVDVLDDERSGLYGLGAQPGLGARGKGLRVLVEVAAFAACATFGLALLCGELGAKFLGTAQIRRVARGDAFVESSLDALGALPLQAVRALDGVSWCEGERPETSEFRVDLKVAPQKDGRLEIVGQLTDLRTGSAGRRFTTQRGKG